MSADITRRVCIRGTADEQGQPSGGVIYVGRPLYRGGWRLAGHRLANPHRVGKPCRVCDGQAHTAAEAVGLYRAYLLGAPELLALLPSLRGQTLGCFCPLGQPCHVDVVIELADADAQLGDAEAGAPVAEVPEVEADRVESFALVCCVVRAGRVLRDGSRVHVADDRLLLDATIAHQLAIDGVVKVLDDDG